MVLGFKLYVRCSLVTVWVNGEQEQAKFRLHYCISYFGYIGKPSYLSMPKFLASCHCNEEEINRRLREKKYRILASPNERKQVSNRSNPEKTGRSCEGADFRWLSSRVFRTLLPGRGREIVISTLLEIISIEFIQRCACPSFL